MPASNFSGLLERILQKATRDGGIWCADALARMSAMFDGVSSTSTFQERNYLDALKRIVSGDLHPVEVFQRETVVNLWAATGRAKPTRKQIKESATWLLEKLS